MSSRTPRQTRCQRMEHAYYQKSFPNVASTQREHIRQGIIMDTSDSIVDEALIPFDM